MELYLKLIDVLFPVFFIIGIGYYIGKKDSKFNTKFITNFAGTIGTPAMIFYTITTTGVTLEIFVEYFLYAVIILGIFAAIGFVFLLLLKKDPITELRSIYKRLNEFEKAIHFNKPLSKVKKSDVRV